MNSFQSKVLYKELEIIRNFPKNIVDKDEHLFTQTLKGVSKAVKLIEFNNVSVNNELFVKDRFSWNIRPESCGDIWQVPIYNTPAYRLKSLLKNARRRRKKIDTALWCFDLFSTGGYFHWITEIAPRLSISSEYIDKDIPILIPAYFLSKWPFAIEVLKPFNRRLIIFNENELAIVNKMFFISPPGGVLNYQPEPIKAAVETIKKKYYKSSYREKIENIYISRQQSGKRVILNERETIETLSTYGYKTLYLENLPFFDQVNLFCRARQILSIHGAGLSNMAFMDAGIVTEIRHNEENHMLNFFHTLSHTFEHDYYYSLGKPDINNHLPNAKRREDKSISSDLGMLKQLLLAI